MADFVFLSPHQDDEVLSMGGAITNHIQVHGDANVHVYLWTDGRGSGAKGNLANGCISCTGVTYQANLTYDQFVLARDNEFRASCANMLVRPENVHIYKQDQPDRPVNGGVTQADADNFLDFILTRHPGAHVKTQSDKDPSPEHAYLGIALRARANAKDPRLGSARWYYPQYQLDKKPTTLSVYSEKAADTSKAWYAGREYGYVNPDRTRYGIGYISVPYAFGGEALKVKIKRADGTWWQPGPLVTPNTSFLDTRASLVHM